MKNVSQDQHVNIGQGSDISIEDLTKLVMKTVGFDGSVTKDLSKPDGTPRKIMDDTQLKAMGWSPRFDLESGLKDAYKWFTQHLNDFREVLKFAPKILDD